MIMQSKYWVQYRYGLCSYELADGKEQSWTVVNDFVTVGESTEWVDLEMWWRQESYSTCKHELLQVVKL